MNYFPNVCPPQQHVVFILYSLYHLVYLYDEAVDTSHNDNMYIDSYNELYDEILEGIIQLT